MKNKKVIQAKYFLDERTSWFANWQKTTNIHKIESFQTTKEVGRHSTSEQTDVRPLEGGHKETSPTKITEVAAEGDEISPCKPPLREQEKSVPPPLPPSQALRYSRKEAVPIQTMEMGTEADLKFVKLLLFNNNEER